MDSIAARLLRYLPAALAGLCLIRLALWVPHYLTWPWWGDHDVFATMAQAWDAGLLPYRDLFGNNFPGTIYLFWVVGRVAGWGNTAAFYALDVLLLLLLGGVVLAWSRRRFGRVLPGLVGCVTLLSYYLTLDFSLAAQRDWHGPLFAVAGMLVAQAWPGRAGRLLSAVLLAFGLVIRPQAVLLLPAWMLAIDEGARPSGRPWSESAGAVFQAGLALAVALGLLLAPLAWEGLLGDFLRGVRAVAYAGGYNQVTPRSFAYQFARQLNAPWVAAVPVAAACLAWAEGATWRRMTLTWVVALLGVLFYLPLSPIPRPYLYHPLHLVWAINAAVLANLVIESSPSTPGLRLAALILILGMNASAWPTFCAPVASVRALAAWRRGVPTTATPPGYQHPYGPSVILPPWADYRDALEYLRRETSPGTRVANALKGIAITAPAARLPAFPAESATWLFVVRPGDEGRFARALEESRDSVVVWAPGDEGPESIRRFKELDSAIRRLYRPAARFGAIEIWRRRPAT
jgi:hypothetical protein